MKKKKKTKKKIKEKREREKKLFREDLCNSIYVIEYIPTK